MPKEKLDNFHYHEALDRCHITISFIEDTLFNHHVFTKHEDLQLKVGSAMDIISKLYKEVGKLIDNKNK